MDELDRAYMHEQIEARLHDVMSGDAEAFRRHLARIRQQADGQFEQRTVSTRGDSWLPYLPEGFPYGQREVEALQDRGDVITEDNVLVRYPREALEAYPAGGVRNVGGSRRECPAYRRSDYALCLYYLSRSESSSAGIRPGRVF
jgi:hypothetical protein